MAYCDLDDVKRLLSVLSNASGNNQYKVRFSDAYEIPKAYSTNQGSGILKGITSIVTSYAGSEHWWIEFTSGTAFTLYRGEDESSPDGNGDTSASFTSTSGIVTIGTAMWTGTPQSGDKFKFRTDSNIATDDGDEFINDADAIITGKLHELIDSDELEFTEVPALIARASMYQSANLIFSSVFSNLNTEDVPPAIKRYSNLSSEMIRTYLASLSGVRLRKATKHARFVSREPLFEKVGITEAEGVEGMKGEIDAVDVEYDEDFNEQES